MGNQDLRAVFPYQREYRCCAAACLQNVDLADRIRTRIAAQLNLAGKTSARDLTFAMAPLALASPAKRRFSPPIALSALEIIVVTPCPATTEAHSGWIGMERLRQRPDRPDAPRASFTPASVAGRTAPKASAEASEIERRRSLSPRPKRRC